MDDLLIPLRPESARTTPPSFPISPFSSSSEARLSFREAALFGSYIVGTRFCTTCGTIAGCPVIPRAEAVGSKEQLSLALKRRHAWTIAVITVTMFSRAPVPAVMTKALLRMTSMMNIFRSAESMSLSVSLKVPKVIDRLMVQPNAAAMPQNERSSNGTRTEEGISTLGSLVDKMTSSMVRNASEH